MRALTSIEVSYVSGGQVAAPSAPPSVPRPEDDKESPVDKLLGSVIDGYKRFADAIAGAIEDIGQGVRGLLTDGATTERLKIGSFEYSKTSCEPGQNLDGDKCSNPPGGT